MVPKDTEAWKLQYMKSPGWHCFSCWGHWEVLSHARCQPVGEGSSLKPLLVQPLLVACCTGEEPGRILSVSVCESVHALPWPCFLSMCLSVPAMATLPVRLSVCPLPWPCFRSMCPAVLPLPPYVSCALASCGTFKYRLCVCFCADKQGESLQTPEPVVCSWLK